MARCDMSPAPVKLKCAMVHQDDQLSLSRSLREIYALQLKLVFTVVIT